MNQRTFTVQTVDRQTVQINRGSEGLFLDGLPTVFITPDATGLVCIFTGRSGWTIDQLHRSVFDGATFWDILYDVPPTKELAGQLQALLMQLKQLSHLFMRQQESE